MPAVAILIASVGWASHRFVKRTLEADLRDEVITVLNANVAALDIWLDTQSRLAAVMAADPSVRDPILSLVSQPPVTPSPMTNNRPGGRRFAPLTPLQSEVQSGLDSRLRSAGYGAALVLGTNLQVMATSQRARNRLGETLDGEHAVRVQQALASGRPAFVMPFKAGFGRLGGRGRPPGETGGRPPRLRDNGLSRPAEGPGITRDGETAPGPRPPREGTPGPRIPPTDLNLMEVIAPVLDSQGTAVAAMVFVLRPEEEFTRVLSIARPGVTGETFAFDAAGRLISASRFDEQLRRLGLLTNNTSVSSALNIELRDPGLNLTTLTGTNHDIWRSRLSSQPLMGMVAAALSTTNNPSGLSMEPERDYRGVPVVGAWRWNPERHYGIATKIDAAEAFRPLQLLRRVVMALLLLLALAMTVMFIVAHAGAVWQARFDEERLKARQLGQYTLLARIGEGAMGVVYRARHAFLRRDTAVKLLLPDRADDALIRQFEQEVRLTCTLAHPNTIQIYDYGRTHDGIFYYAMELLHGLTLHQLVERHGPQPAGRVIHLLAQAAQSLREAHAAGLIHRDIKPGNLFLCQRGGIPDTLKVLDFGLVRRVSSTASAPLEPSSSESAHRFLGTPLYMAPETIRHPGFGDARSDLYALAAVGHVLLTGRALFEGQTAEAIWHQQENTLPAPLSCSVPGPVSQALDELLLRCLAKDPAERPSSMDEFLSLLLACPEAGSWTETQRAEWWKHHAPPETSDTASSGTTGSPTLMIPATQREPVRDEGSSG